MVTYKINLGLETSLSSPLLLPYRDEVLVIVGQGGRCRSTMNVTEARDVVSRAPAAAITVT